MTLQEKEDKKTIQEIITQLKSLKNHYSKKDDLIYPLLKQDYYHPQIVDNLWAKENEISDEFIYLHDKDGIRRVIAIAQEIMEIEEKILFNLTVECFSKEEWIRISNDIPIYDACLIEELPQWNECISVDDEFEIKDDVIELPGGQLTIKQIRAILNVIPMEITIIDAENINRFFDEDKNKVFKRPKMALNRNMFSCHPKRIERMVTKLIDDFKEGKRDSMHVMAKVDGREVLTNYYALRDENDEYIGTMEAVIHIDGIVESSNANKSGPIKVENAFPN